MSWGLFALPAALETAQGATTTQERSPSTLDTKLHNACGERAVHGQRIRPKAAPQQSISHRNPSASSSSRLKLAPVVSVWSRPNGLPMANTFCPTWNQTGGRREAHAPCQGCTAIGGQPLRSRRECAPPDGKVQADDRPEPHPTSRSLDEPIFSGVRAPSCSRSMAEGTGAVM